MMRVAGIGKDRRPIGGAVLGLASDEDQLTLILGNDRLHGELQRVLLDATVALVECGARTMRAGQAG